MNNNQSITPQFFGPVQPYQQPQKKDKNDLSSYTVSDPSNNTNNPYWENDDHPPPYSPSSSSLSPQVPSSLYPTSEVDSTPSAPPLEEDPYYGAAAGFRTNYNARDVNQSSHPTTPHRNNYQNILQSSFFYPRRNEGYGAVPSSESLQTNNFKDDQRNSVWRWCLSLVDYYPEVEEEQHLVSNSEALGESTPPTTFKKIITSNTCKLFGLLFFVIIFALFMTRIFLLLFVDTHDDITPFCPSGETWNALPKEFSFEKSLTIRITGNILTGGTINVKSIPYVDKYYKEETKKGIVKLSMVYSPANMADNLSLRYTLRESWSGGKILEIYATESSTTTAKDRCIHFDSVVYVPNSLINEINIDVHNTNIKVTNDKSVNNNVESFVLKTSNNAIDFSPVWTGKRLDLETTNSNVIFDNNIKAQEGIFVSIVNGDVIFKNSIKSEKTTTIYSTDGGVSIKRTLESKIVDIRTTNRPINVYNLTSEFSQLKTTNNQIQVEHANVDILRAESQNAPITVHMENSKFNSKAKVITTKGDVELFMPLYHEGSFELQFEEGKSILVMDYLNWSRVEVFNTLNYVFGHRFDPNTTRNNNSLLMGSAHISTTDSHALSLYYTDDLYN